MSEPFLGEIGLFGFSYAPRGWSLCQGQILSITQNTALFSLLGTTYGGDGKSTFALPNLQGNITVGAGQGPGLASYALGQRAGSTSVTLLTATLPPHTHALTAGTAVTTATPAANTYIGVPPRGKIAFATATDGTQMNQAIVSPAGGSQPHNNMMPYLTLNYCICLQGLYPSRS